MPNSIVMRKLSWFRKLAEIRPDRSGSPSIVDALAGIWEEAYVDSGEAMANPIATRILAAFKLGGPGVTPRTQGGKADPEDVRSALERLTDQQLMAIRGALEQHHFMFPVDVPLRFQVPMHARPQSPAPAPAAKPAETWSRQPADPALQRALEKLRRRPASAGHACNWFRTVVAISGVDTEDIDPVDIPDPRKGVLTVLPKRRRKTRTTPRMPGATPSADIDR
jgi:hypothetical protein